MTYIAAGQPDLNKLSSGVEHTDGETRNLGELFKEAIKKQPVTKPPNKIKKKNIPKFTKQPSGIKRVAKYKGFTYKKNFYFKYSYMKDGRQTGIQRKTLKKLYLAVKEIGHDFIIVDKKLAISFINNHCSYNDTQFLLKELCLTEVI